MKRPIVTLNLPEYKIQQLHKKGYIFCEDVDIETIRSVAGITIEEWKKLTVNTNTITALDLCQIESDNSHIVSFSQAFDELLGQGIPVKSITEICGLAGTGKTQICLQLSISVQIPICFGGLAGHSVYIATNFSLTPHRLSEIAKGCIQHCHLVANKYNSFEMMESIKEFTEISIMNGVHCQHINNFVKLLASVPLLKKLLSNNSKIRLIVIDNISQVVKSTKLEYFERIKILYTYFSDLQKLAHIYNFAIVLTNNLTTKINNKENSFVPCFGDSFAHRNNNRILLKRKSENHFSATSFKCVLNSETTINFQIVQNGIRDIR
ncbi:spindle B [Carabus blaptoides fortunei]